MKTKIAFDLDGVFVPDYNHIPGLSQAEFYEQTLYAKPLFNPTYPYDIVTARSVKYKDVTYRWINQLARPPEKIFMMQEECTDTPAKFKYDILKHNNHYMYIESDESIALEIMKQSTEDLNKKLVVYQFDSWINNKIMLS